jgi:hypothetical protein
MARAPEIGQLAHSALATRMDTTPEVASTPVVFGGVQLRDADIYATLAAHKDTVRGLATKYGVAEHQVADAHARVAALVGVTKGNGNGQVHRPA